jgi:hypothetical protein
VAGLERTEAEEALDGTQLGTSEVNKNEVYSTFASSDNPMIPSPLSSSTLLL